MRHFLLKRVKHNIRYYKMEFFLSLFDEYAIIREYGNIRFKGPTGKRLKYYKDSNRCKKEYFKILQEKKSRGYVDDRAFI